MCQLPNVHTWTAAIFSFYQAWWTRVVGKMKDSGKSPLALSQGAVQWLLFLGAPLLLLLGIDWKYRQIIYIYIVYWTNKDYYWVPVICWKYLYDKSELLLRLHSCDYVCQVCQQTHQRDRWWGWMGIYLYIYIYHIFIIYLSYIYHVFIIYWYYTYYIYIYAYIQHIIPKWWNIQSNFIQATRKIWTIYRFTYTTTLQDLDGLDLFAGKQSVTRGFSLDLRNLSTIIKMMINVKLDRKWGYRTNYLLDLQI